MKTNPHLAGLRGAVTCIARSLRHHAEPERPPALDHNSAMWHSAAMGEAALPARESDGVQTVTTVFIVEPNYAGWRLDQYLQQKIRRLSRSRIQRIIAKSLTSDRPLKPSTLVFPGLRLTLTRAVAAEPDVPPPSAVRDLYFDDALLVVDKPAGLPMHPSARYLSGTLATYLHARFGREQGVAPAHRLDRETSGIVVCGRGSSICAKLMRMFVEGKVRKKYLAICEGRLAQSHFEVDAPIAEGTTDIRVAVRIDHRVGKEARTRFEVVNQFEREGAWFSLVRCIPLTGRQHQIRVHLAHLGYPLVGDKMYGPDPAYFDRFSRGSLEEDGWRRLRLPRHALHAHQIELPHPVTGTTVAWSSDLPNDLKDFLAGKPTTLPQGRADDDTV